MKEVLGFVRCPRGQLLSREVAPDGTTVGFLCAMCQLVTMSNIKITESLVTKRIVDPNNHRATIEVTVKECDYQISCPNVAGYNAEKN